MPNTNKKLQGGAIMLLPALALIKMTTDYNDYIRFAFAFGL